MFKNFFRQSLNFPAVVQLGSSFLTPNLFVPHQFVYFNDIDVKQLQKECKFIIFDKDNTLTYAYENTFHPQIKTKLDEFKLLFPNRIAILSNSVGSCDDEGYKEAATVEHSLEIPVIRHKKKKPDCLQEVIDHVKLTTGTEIINNQICLVGDRLFTDVLFANTNGMKSILVHPISHFRDHPIAAFIRLFETKFFLPFLKILRVKPPP